MSGRKKRSGPFPRPMVAEVDEQARAERIGRQFVERVRREWASFIEAAPEGRVRASVDAQAITQFLLVALLDAGGDHCAQIHGVGRALGGVFAQSGARELMEDALAQGVELGVEQTPMVLTRPVGRA